MTDNELLLALSDLFDNKLKKELQPIDGNIDNMKNNLSIIDNNINVIQNNIKDIRLTLENETNRNIMRIAEGHLDLSRKLDDALKVENEKEMLVIRVNILENELRQIKDRLATIA